MRHFTPDQHRRHLLRQLRACAEPRRHGASYCPMVVRMTPHQAAAMWLQNGDTFAGARVEVCGYGCAESVNFVESPINAPVPAMSAARQYTYGHGETHVVNSTPFADTFAVVAPAAETVE